MYFQGTYKWNVVCLLSDAAAYNQDFLYLYSTGVFAYTVVVVSLSGQKYCYLLYRLLLSNYTFFT